MRIAIMQPYFFPYIGYFQLINAVDKFVFYDDVNFIKRGWINRNNILVNNKPTYITIKLSGASQNKLINQIRIINKSDKILQTINMAYRRAPYFEPVITLIESFFAIIKDDMLISQVAGKSIEYTSHYLGLNKVFEYSSEKYSHTKKYDRADRLIEIAKENNAQTYLNAEGGKELYTKEYFAKRGIKLKFINSRISEYQQFTNKFIPYLSIIDVMMFNSPEKIRDMLDDQIYPFVQEENNNLKENLITNKILTAIYWPNVKDWLDGRNYWKTFPPENLLTIPIDQRYSMEINELI